MALVHYKRRDPWQSLNELQNEMNDVFSTWFGNSDYPAVRDDIMAPTVDMWEDDNMVHVEADLPGMDQKDINVDLKGNTLHISANKEEKKEEKKKNYYRTERYQGGFYRSLELPSAVDNEKIKAAYKNGVLSITVPKREEAKERSIRVDVE